MLDFGTSKSNSEISKIKFVENYYFLKNYVTSEGAVSHNVLYYITALHYLSPIILSNYQKYLVPLNE